MSLFPSPLSRCCGEDSELYGMPRDSLLNAVVGLPFYGLDERCSWMLT